MKALNKNHLEQHAQKKQILQDQFDAQLELLDKVAPKPVVLRQNSTDKPRVLADGVIVMPEDYFYEDEDENPIVVAKADVGENKIWQPIK